jgi:hypothetical protein
MLNEDSDKATEQFKKRFSEKGFTVARMPNTADDYWEKQLDKDSEAVSDFVKTDLFDHIMGNKAKI